MSEEVTAKAAVENMLAHRVQYEAGFLEQLVVDPNGTVQPMLGEVLADDGAMDLSNTNITVHLETDRNLHFVVSLAGDGDDEVSGYAMDLGLASSLKTMIAAPTLSAKGTTKDTEGLCTASGVCVCDTTKGCAPEKFRA